MNIFDYINSKAIAAYWNTKSAESAMAPFLGEILFPDKKQLGMDLKYIKGTKGMPAVLNLSALDAKSIKKNRIGVSEIKTKLPFFKNEMSIDEETRQELLKVQNSGDEYVKPLIDKIFDDETILIEDARVTREVMRMQLLGTGKITMANNGQEIEYDYGLSQSQKPTAQTAWSNPAADIIGDIISWQDSRENAGYARPTRAITSRAVVRNMMKNTAIKNAVYVFANGVAPMTESMLKAFILDQIGVTIEVYEKKYKALDGTVTRMLPADVFVLIPDGELGNTVFGTTPEEADLLASKRADVTLVDTGVAVTTWDEVDPVNKHTKVSEMVMPSFEEADSIVIADVQ